jgi:hypothetical protein
MKKNRSMSALLPTSWPEHDPQDREAEDPRYQRVTMTTENGVAVTGGGRIRPLYELEEEASMRLRGGS